MPMSTGLINNLLRIVVSFNGYTNLVGMPIRLQLMSLYVRQTNKSFRRVHYGLLII